MRHYRLYLMIEFKQKGKVQNRHSSYKLSISSGWRKLSLTKVNGLSLPSLFIKFLQNSVYQRLLDQRSLQEIVNRGSLTDKNHRLTVRRSCKNFVVRGP